MDINVIDEDSNSSINIKANTPAVLVKGFRTHIEDEYEWEDEVIDDIIDRFYEGKGTPRIMVSNMILENVYRAKRDGYQLSIKW